MITAMQMMLDDLISKREVYENAKMYQCVATLETSIEITKHLLEKEKEQIIDAYNQGTLDGESSMLEYPNYYNQTFNQNK
jgi:hypothetical protein